MKPEEALQILSNAVGQINTSLQNHQLMQNALKVLQDEVNKAKLVPAPKLASER